MRHDSRTLRWIIVVGALAGALGVAFAAPIGGALLIASWLAIAAAAVFARR